MACVGNKVVCSPFALIGSIGVVCYVPNIQRLLENNLVDMHLFTAGKWKRTVDVVGDVTDEGKAKMREELVRLHGDFANHVKHHRPQLDTEEVCTGEAWSGREALGLGLVDELQSSDEYLASKMATHDVVKVRKAKKKKRGLLYMLLEDGSKVGGGTGIRGGLPAIFPLATRTLGALFRSAASPVQQLLQAISLSHPLAVPQWGGMFASGAGGVSQARFQHHSHMV